MNNILMTASVALSTQQMIKTQTRRGFKFKRCIRDYAKNMGEDYCLKHQNKLHGEYDWSIRERSGVWADYTHQQFLDEYAPYKIGETLWIREPAKIIGYNVQPDRNNIELKYEFLSDRSCHTLYDIPERFIEVGDHETLPEWIKKCKGVPNGCIREMARTFIRITDIRIERLNEISEEDAIKEGINRISGDEGNNYNPEYYHGQLLTHNNQFWSTPKFFDSAYKAFNNLWESINGKNSFNNRWVWVIEFELTNGKDI